ncbi:hypothetical protein OTSUT76_1490 [Orientia tsutsugamushi str. UT76]|nr:hypothetical protein OTSUT76_1490 [Orientia tsutsugamushi str. UT76]
MRPVVFDFLTNSCNIIKKYSNNNATIFITLWKYHSARMEKANWR